MPHKTARGAAALDRSGNFSALLMGISKRMPAQSCTILRRLKTFEGIPHPYDRKKRCLAGYGRLGFIKSSVAIAFARNGRRQPSKSRANVLSQLPPRLEKAWSRGQPVPALGTLALCRRGPQLPEGPPPAPGAPLLPPRGPLQGGGAAATRKCELWKHTNK